MPARRPVLRIGSSGPDVTDVQLMLHVAPTGVFDVETDLAVRAYQRARGGLRVDGEVGPMTWASLLEALPWPPKARRDCSPGEALAAVASQCLGVREGRTSNRGERVDELIRLGGFKLPSAATTAGPAWCGWFGAACVGFCDDAGFSVWQPARHRRGLATAWWLDAPEDRRIAPEDVWDHEGEGLVIVLVRRSADRDAVLRGEARQGHFGVRVGIDRATRTVHVVAGNSTGQGHATGTGSVAREQYRQGSSRWGRVVGFIRAVGA